MGKASRSKRIKQATNTVNSINFDPAESFGEAFRREIAKFWKDAEKDVEKMVFAKHNLIVLKSELIEKAREQAAIRGIPFDELGDLHELIRTMENIENHLYTLNLSAVLGNFTSGENDAMTLRDELHPKLNSLVDQMDLLAKRYLAAQDQKIEETEKLAKQGIDPFSGAL